MPNSLNTIITIIGLLGSLTGLLWTFIKLSEWWGNKGKEREERIDLELEWIEDLTTQARGLNDTEVISLI